MSKQHVLLSWRYYKACSPICGINYVLLLFFFTAWIFHLLFCHINGTCPLLFGDMYAETLCLLIVKCFNDCGGNGACYWTIMESGEDGVSLQR